MLCPDGGGYSSPIFSASCAGLGITHLEWWALSPRVPYLRVILINKSDSRTDTDQKGKGPGKLSWRLEKQLFSLEKLSLGEEMIFDIWWAAYWQSSDLKRHKPKQIWDQYIQNLKPNRLPQHWGCSGNATTVNSGYTLETPRDVLNLSKPGPHSQPIKLESLEEGPGHGRY